jgi:hypothetical protein
MSILRLSLVLAASAGMLIAYGSCDGDEKGMDIMLAISTALLVGVIFGAYETVDKAYKFVDEFRNDEVQSTLEKNRQQAARAEASRSIKGKCACGADCDHASSSSSSAAQRQRDEATTDTEDTPE